MRIVFLSNFYNHHQSQLSQQMSTLLGGEYYFIATGRMSREREEMGWKTSACPDFVHKYSDETDVCNDLINSADVVIIGSAPVELIKERLKDDKLTFIYRERLDKETLDFPALIRNTIRLQLTYGSCKNLYCICASAFTAYDFSRRRLLINRCYKWGYFPETYKYESVESILNLKREDPVYILFVSRLIEWKHPEIPVCVAKKLKEEGIRFHLTVIGIGDMEAQIDQMIVDYDLMNEITHLRSVSPQEVRRHMERASVFLFTSDRNEGWGVVLNESMNSCCAVVASSAIGSVPFLLEDGKNGYIYQDGNFDDLYIKVKKLCLNKKKRESFGSEAYKTIVNTWNAENAADRMIKLIEDLQRQGKSDRFADGPCSRAGVLKDDWYNS